MGIPVRGVSQIKTLAQIRGSGVHSNERHVHQFQIASLELERSRHARERLAAVRRVNGIDARLLELNVLIEKHQKALGVITVEAGRDDSERELEATPAANEKRRKLRY